MRYLLPIAVLAGAPLVATAATAGGVTVSDIVTSKGFSIRAR